MRIKSIFYLFTAFIPALCLGQLKQTEKNGVIEIRSSKIVKRSSSAKTISKSDFDDIIEAECTKNTIDPYLIKCIIKIESDFNPKAKSCKGAMGLMQLMPATAKIYRIKDAYDPAENIYAGTRHFAGLMDEFSNDVIMALAAYHAGSSRVKKAGGVPPIKDTINYVKSVLSFYEPRTAEEIEKSVKKVYSRISGETIEFRN